MRRGEKRDVCVSAAGAQICQPAPSSALCPQRCFCLLRDGQCLLQLAAPEWSLCTLPATLSLFIARRSSYRCYLACVTLVLVIVQGPRGFPHFSASVYVSVLFWSCYRAPSPSFSKRAQGRTRRQRRVQNRCRAKQRPDCNLCYLITGRSSTSERASCHFAEMASAVL